MNSKLKKHIKIFTLFSVSQLKLPINLLLPQLLTSLLYSCSEKQLWEFPSTLFIFLAEFSLAETWSFYRHKKKGKNPNT